MGRGAQLKDVQVLETGHTVATFEMADHSLVKVTEPSRIFSRVVKYGAFQSFDGRVIFPREQLEKISASLNTPIKDVTVPVNGQLRISTESAAVVINNSEDLENPKLRERVFNLLHGSVPVVEEVALKRIQLIKNSAFYVGTYVTEADTSYLFQNVLGEIHVFTSPTAYLQYLNKGGGFAMRLCRDVVRK